MKIAVVGAGWAGLAAVSQCLHHGMDVELFDAAHTPGGRARGVFDPQLGELDNGQHLLLGAYEQTLRLIERDLGSDSLGCGLMRLPLWLKSSNGQFEMRANPHLPQRLQNPVALWRAKGLSLSDKWQATTLLLRLQTKHRKRTNLNPNLTVSDWLTQEKQGPMTCQWIWNPLCLATLNTDPHEASAALFAKVLIDSLLNNRPGATDLLIPRTNLSALWPNALAKRVKPHWGHIVREVTPHTNGVTIDGQWFDYCVLAVPPPNLRRLIAKSNALVSITPVLDHFKFRSIATCYVALKQHHQLPAPMLMFPHTNHPNQLGQWVFDRSAFMHNPVKAQLAFVISDASSITTGNDIALAESLMSQLNHDLLRENSSVVVGARCFHEKRATFAALPGLKRPAMTTPCPQVLLAGDWTNTGYPAVIEGAVMSGVRAADHITTLA
jgi:squalene-associated FAD-dependent desaturase